MGASTTEYFNKWEATRMLRDGLEETLNDLFDHKLNEADKELLMKMNLILIRQCLEDFGASAN